MKEETKGLVDWIKKQISLASTVVTDASQPYWQLDHNKAVKFLDSLPEIESHLCRGGYIQDKNGTPCCDGDEVVFTYYNDVITIPKKKGVLRWSYAYKMFVILENNNEYDFDDILEFEKV